MFSASGVALVSFCYFLKVILTVIAYCLVLCHLWLPSLTAITADTRQVKVSLAVNVATVSQTGRRSTLYMALAFL